jgi:RNA polymerase sigma factor (sigma-70 family)
MPSEQTRPISLRYGLVGIFLLHTETQAGMFRLITCGDIAAMDENEPDWSRLVVAARTGDAAAARLLVERLFPQVAGRIGGLLPRRGEVEDLAQEVFLRVFSRLGQFDDGSFPAWVDSITRHVCYDALRRQRVRPEWRFADFPEDPPEQADDKTMENTDAAEIIARLFSAILPEQAWLLREVEIAGRGIGQVSSEMGWTAAGGRLRLFRARNALKRAYDHWKEI